MLVIIIVLLINNNSRNSDDDYGVLEIVDTNKEAIEENSEVEEKNDSSGTDNIVVEVNENNNIVDNTIENSNYEEENSIDGSAFYDENDVVSYIESNEKDIKNNSFKDKFKEYFIEIVDFIFYGTEIKGHTFNELTNTGKLKVISAALKIDSYIEEKSPGYKDTIKSTSSRVYNNTKEKLTTLFFDISSNVCKDKEEDCNNAKELFSEIKSTCKIGWSFIKELLKNGGNKLKDWYEIYSGK